ncbi:MAG: NifU family protein [Bacteroidetes Order II. Incertae sedis bacterium]|nr:NifU family protein [Bacteroidetes Order II. bacterium]
MFAYNDPTLLKKVEDALELIRPYLQADGGSVRIADITPDMVVELELLGACESCPMSLMTLRAGIEQTIKNAVPQISRVEAVNVAVAH